MLRFTIHADVPESVMIIIAELKTYIRTDVQAIVLTMHLYCLMKQLVLEPVETDPDKNYSTAKHACIPHFYKAPHSTRRVIHT